VPILVVGALIVVWQAVVSWEAVHTFTLRRRLEHPWQMAASAGMCEEFPGLFYFFHHFGVFPVGTTHRGPLPERPEDARRFVAEQGRTLVMDFNRPCAVRCGDLGKIFMFLPGVLLGRSATRPTVFPFNALFFVGALVAVWVAFAARGRPLLGVLLVLFLGSDPFQVFETYVRTNVFSLTISVALIVLALHLRLLTGAARIDRRAAVIALFTGGLLAFVREMRPEAAIVGVTLPFVYLGVRRSPVALRLAALASCLIGYTLVSQGLERYIDAKFPEAQAFVARAGGHPYPGLRVRHHAAWHNLFLGLGDFDTRHGYAWDDVVAYRYAVPLLHERYGMPVTYSGGYYLDQYYGDDHFYRIKPEDLPEYSVLLREKVLRDIREDPTWYLSILGRRVVAILADTTPVGLALGPWWVPVPGSRWLGWLAIPVLVVAAMSRKWLYVGLLLGSLALSLPALLVYAKEGMTYYGVFHVVALCIAVQMAVERWRELP
jgi:hypothetical protein